MNKHIATHNGQTFTRNSKTRTYSHVVLGRLSYDRKLKSVMDCAELDAKNYEYYSSVAYNTGAFTYEVAGKEAERIVEQYPSKQAYVDALQAERLADLAEEKANGRFDRFSDLGWCGRLDLAQKKFSSEQGNGRYAEVIIVEVTH